VSPDYALDQHVVTAVIVAHDGAGWIPRMAEGVLEQTRPVQRVVAVDTGSRDRSGAMLAGLFGRAAVFGMDRGTGYAAAVTHALRHRAASGHVPGTGGRIEWVWLIHDDCQPAPDALLQLLQAADETPSAAILGPKVMDWTDRRVILEAGVAIDPAGRRVTGLEPREVDQGQHDGDRDVLAVSSAGMLIRRDVWDQIGGFDPGMRLFREDVDFCWRAQAAGHRVRLVTGAVVYHQEASARNRRQTSAAPRPRREDRRNALITLVGNLPAGPMLRTLAGSTVLSLLRTMFYLVAKRPGAGVDEFTALLSVAGHPLRILRARRPRARGRRAAYGRLRASIPPARTLGRLFEFVAAALSKSTAVDTIGSHHATEDPSDDDSLLVDSGFMQRVLTSPGVLLFLALTVVTLVAERSVLGGGPLGGGALTPAWGGASGLWQEYLQSFHPAGIGSAASTPPYVAVLAFLATLLLGKTWLAVDLLLIGCVPLAGLTAYLAAGRFTRFAPARVWAAAAYALLPTGMGAVAAGRLGTAVVFVLLPLIGLLAGRMFTQAQRRARRAAWAVALLTVVAAAFVPLVWLAVAAVVVTGGLVFARSRPGMALNLAIVAAVPPVLLLPWSLQLATHPATLFLESGLQQPGLAQAGLPARSLLLLSAGGPGLPPYWVTGGLLAAALVTVVAAGRRAAVLAGWGVALAGLLAAAGISRLVITPPGGGQAVAAWPGAMLAFAGAGLVLAVAVLGDSLREQLAAGRWRSPAGLGAMVVGLLACSAPLLAAASWVTAGVSGPLTRVASPVLPEFVAVSSAGGTQTRTLVLQAGAHGTVSYEVLRGADPLIGEPGLAPVPAASQALSTTVADLIAPSGGEAQDQGRALAGFGIGYVLLPSPASPALAQLLDGVAGLRPVSQTASFQLWRVTGPVARVRVVEAGGTVVPVPSGPVGASGVAAPPAGGELVLAEPAGGWTASLNGRPLAQLPPAGGWAQAFRLPAGGGTLTISHSQLGRDVEVLLECLAVLAVAALALPGARVAGEVTEQSAVTRRPAGSRTSARAGGRQAGRRGRTGPSLPEQRATVPGPRASGPAEDDEPLAGLATGPGGPGRPAEGTDVSAAGGPGRPVGRGGVPADSGYPVGGGLARRSAASGAPAGGPPGTRGRHGEAAGSPGRRAGKRAGGLLGRGRAGRDRQDETAAYEAGLEPDGTHSARGRRGRSAEAYPGDAHPGERYGSGGRPTGPGGYRGTGSEEYGSGAYPDGGADGTGGYGTDGYGTDGYRTDGYGTDGYGTDGYGTDGYGTDGYRTDGYPTRGPGRGGSAGGHRGGAGGGYPGSEYPDAGSGGYGTGEYSGGGGPAAGDAGRARAGEHGAGQHGAGQHGAGQHGSGGYSTGGYSTGGYGPGYAAESAGSHADGGYQGDDARGREGRSREARAGDARERGEDHDGGGRGRRVLGRRRQADDDRGSSGSSRQGRGRRGGGGREGARQEGARQEGARHGSGARGSRDGHQTGGYPAGDYGSGEYRTGGQGGGYQTGGYPAGDYGSGEYRTGGQGGGYQTGGYPAGDYASGGYPAGDYASGGYPAGDYGSGEYRTGGQGGGYQTGGYPAGDYASGGYPAGGYSTGGYQTGGYPAGDYGSGGYHAGGAGDHATGGYGAGDYGSGGYREDGGYGDGDPAGAGGGRKRPGGRGKASKGRAGRRPGRGDR
jgi:GT2 family glycosyltransferase